jgi:hypothetical protein
MTVCEILSESAAGWFYFAAEVAETTKRTGGEISNTDSGAASPSGRNGARVSALMACGW